MIDLETLVSKTKLPPIITSTPSSIGPVPTVIPGPSPLVQEIGLSGKRTLWVVTVLMGLSSLVFYALSTRPAIPKRLMHTLVAITTTVSFITYLALATGSGNTWKHDFIPQQHKHVPDTSEQRIRQVLWLRYLNWAITDPLILTNLALLSGLPGANLLVAIVANWVMVGTGLLGTFNNHRSVRWVWFVISCFGYLVMVYQVGIHGSRAASNKDASTRRFFGPLAGTALLVKVLFPISLAAGGLALRMSVDTETIMYAILDILAQGILSYWLLIAHDSSAQNTTYVDGFWSRGFSNEGAIRITDEDGA